MSVTFKRPKLISVVVNSGEANAGQKSILVPKTSPTEATDEFIYNINIKRADIDKTQDAKHFYDVNSGTVVVKTNSTAYVLTTDDEITISGTYL